MAPRRGWEHHALVAAVAATCLTVGRPARAELNRVWVVDDGTKVGAAELQHPLATGNATFANERVTLFGLRNETVAFQVIVEGGANETRDVRVELDAIGPIVNGPRATDEPDGYWIDRRIEIFEQRYVNVSFRSHSLAWKPWSDAQPADLTGLLPDPLVPHRRALIVPPHTNQGVWIDIYIPKNTPPGVHRGVVRVRVGGATAKELPVELEVGDASLPDSTSTKTMVWFSGGENDRDIVGARYFDDPWKATLAQMDALRRRHYFLARRHRITLFLGQDDAPTPELQARMEGSLFSREAGYDGPGVSVPQDMYSIHTYGGKLTPAEATMWSDWFAAHAPNADSFLYVVDEPHDEALFPELSQIAREAKPVRSFVTHTYDERLAFDIFCAPAALYSPATTQAIGDRAQQWIYNGYRPNTGSFMIDDVAISPRVNAWIQHKFYIPRWFYWEATYYRDSQGGRGHVDVFGDANNFRSGDDDRMNGDGLLIYPGRDRVFPERDAGIDAPLPSIRLKNWRRGIEDVEYLVLVEKAGHRAFAEELMNTLIPAALGDDVTDGDPVSWREDGEAWLRARRALFDTLKASTPPSTDMSALARPPEGAWPRYKRTLKRFLDPLLRSRKRRILSGVAAGSSLLGVAIWLFRRRRRRLSAKPGEAPR